MGLSIFTYITLSYVMYVKGSKPHGGATCFWFLLAPLSQWETSKELCLYMAPYTSLLQHHKHALIYTTFSLPVSAVRGEDSKSTSEYCWLLPALLITNRHPLNGNLQLAIYYDLACSLDCGFMASKKEKETRNIKLAFLKTKYLGNGCMTKICFQKLMQLLPTGLRSIMNIFMEAYTITALRGNHTGKVTDLTMG